MQADSDKRPVQVIERFLNLREGDLKRGLPLFIYNFLIISSFVVGQVVRDTLFLDRFEPEQLPYVDMTIAAFVLVVVAGYNKARKFIPLERLQTVTLLLFAAVAGLFWLSTWLYQWNWLYSALYIWVGIFGVLAPAQMWMLIIYLLSTRDKRLLGLVASGGIAGGIGGFMSRAIVQSFDTEHLLFVMMLLLAAAAWLIAQIWRRWHSQLSGIPASSDGRDKNAWNLRESLKQIHGSNHLRAIGALVCLSSVVTNIAGWQFKATAALSFVEKNDLAAFFGTFYGVVSIVGFIVAQLLAPRVLVLSLGLALVILPLALTAGAIGVLFSGALWATTLLKGSDKIFRYAIEKPAVESLYFPVPSHVMIQVKVFIDTVSWRFGDGLSGLVVFVFATLMNWSARQMSWITLVLLAVWLTAVFIARRQYVSTLSDGLKQHRVNREQTRGQTLDRATSQMLTSRLRAEDTDEILYALGLIDPQQHLMVHPVLRDLLRHPAGPVKAKSLAILNAAADTSVAHHVEQLLHDNDPAVRTEAMLYMAHHMNVDPLEQIEKLADYSDYSVSSAMITYLARSGDPDNDVAAREILNNMIKDSGEEGQRSRLEAAKVLVLLPYQYQEQLAVLIDDPDAEVASEALRAVGPDTDNSIIDAVVTKLSDQKMAMKAAQALARCGERVVEILENWISDPAKPIELRQEIPAVLAKIETPEAAQLLINSMFTEETQLRSKVITALTNLQSRYSELKIDTDELETILIAEIIGHYRSYQIREVLQQDLSHDDTMVKALQEVMQGEMERIFQLIKLMNPSHDLDSAFYGVKSKNPEVRGNALEFLENILKPELRNLLLPVLDPEVSAAERVKLIRRLIGTSIETPSDALLTLLAHPEPWLKSCAVYSIGILGLKSLEYKLDESLNHPDPLLRETAHQAKHRLEILAAGR